MKKRTRNASDSDIDMSEEESKAGKSARSLTPAQRHISAQKRIRSFYFRNESVLRSNEQLYKFRLAVKLKFI